MSSDTSIGGETWAGPLFIAGPSRSGTAMMRSIVNGHPRIGIAGETHFFDDLRARKEFQGGAVAEGSAAVCADYFRALDDRPYGMKGNPEGSPLSQQALIDRARELGGRIDDYFQAYCLAVADRNGKVIWGEKTPRHIFRLTEMLTAFPEAKAICMVRDPRAVVASYRDWRNQGGLNRDEDENFANAIKEEEQRAKISYNILIISMLWRATVNSALKARKQFGADRVRVVRYESLVDAPEAGVHEVCDWLGMDFHPEMLAIPMHNSSVSAYEAKAGVSKSVAKRWAKALSPQEIYIVQRMAGGHLDEFDYERMDVPGASGAFIYEWLRLPVAFVRSLSANRGRITSIVPYVWRRLRASLGG